jgi:hypothetical protein
MLKIGVVYIVFGQKALNEVSASIESLRKFHDYPIATVGNVEVPGTTFIEWNGESPYDTDAIHNFQFKAGRVKPSLYKLSPFDLTLYLDCDTRILQDISFGFQLLEKWDMLIAKHPNQTIAQLYNKPRAGWFHNIKERNSTIQEWDGNGEVPYWNSGVIFWKKCDNIKWVFETWRTEWLRYCQWDEQQALMRAVYNNPCKILVLPESWNHPHKHLAKLIFHNYGRGSAREDGL